MKRLLIIFILALPAVAQYVRVDPTPMLTTPGNVPVGAYPQVLAIPGARVNVCFSPANAVPCSNYANTYNSATALNPCPAGAQVVLAHTNTCVTTTDAQGAFGFWIPSGVTVDYTITFAAGGSVGPWTVTAPGGGGGGGSPTGPAGGDLSGSYPNPGVAKVNAGAVPASANLLATNSSGQLIAQSIPLATSLGGTGTASPAMVAGTGINLTGIFPNYTITNTGVSGTAAGGDLSGTYPNPTVRQINGAIVPPSAGLLGSNGFGQLVGVTVPLQVTSGGTGVTAAQGNGSKFQLATGSPVVGNCAKFDANLNIVDAGGTCGGSGSVPGGSNTQVQFNNSSSFGGAAGFTFDGTGIATLGVASTTTGGLKLYNATGGNWTQLAAGASAPQLRYLFPVAAPTAGQVMTAAAPSGSDVQLSFSSPTTSGAAGGDLSGTYPNPTVAQVNGAAVPASANLVATNSSRQIVAVTTPLAVATGGTGVSAAQGTGTKVQLANGSATLNNCLKYDASGNAVDSGAPCNASSTYITPATGGVTVTNQAQFTSVSNSVIDYGAYCDGVMNSSGTYATGHDDHVALQAAFNALGATGVQTLTFPAAGLPSGPGGVGTTTGVCLSSTTLTIGNGSSSAVSTQNGFTIRGSGGHQKFVTNAGPTNANKFIVPQSGSSVIAYTGTCSSSCGTATFVTVAGPIHNITMDGLAFDCGRQVATCLAFTQIEGSKIHDVAAMNNLAGTNKWNAGLVFSAYNSDFNAAETGSQQNIIDQPQVYSSDSNSGKTGMIFGCQTPTACGGSGSAAGDYDFSGNTIIKPEIITYGDTATGIVVGYADSDTFVGGDFNAGFTPLYVLYNINTLGGNYPNNITFDHWQLSASGSSMTGTATVNGGAIGSTNNCSVSNIATNWTSPVPIPSLIQVDAEVILVTSQTMSGGLSVITGCTRGYGGTFAVTHTGSPLHILGPSGYAVDGTGSTSAYGPYPDAIFFSQAASTSGVQIGPNIYSSQFSANVFGVNGFTQGGYKFNSAGSAAYNELLGTTVVFSGPITPGATFTSMGRSKTVPETATLLNGTVVHVVASYKLTTSGAITAYPGFILSDATGSPVNIYEPFVMSTSPAYVSIDLFINIIQTGSYTAVYLCSGTITYDDGTPSTPGNIYTRSWANFSPSGRSIVNGLTITPAGQFSASTGATMQMLDMHVFVHSPDGSSYF